MAEKQNAIKVFQSGRFEKTLNKLADKERAIVEDEIVLIIDNPEMGEQKKGNLSYLRVHKFRLNNQLARLGYSWQQKQLEMYLLQLGSYENIYDKMKSQRKTDLKNIKD